MTPDRFRTCLDALGWSQNGVAAHLDVNPVTVRRWASGELPIEPRVAEWLETLAQAHEGHEFPRDWT